MSQPNNPPSNPLLGAIYIDQSTNIAWVWTGTYWVQANGSGGYNANVGPGATLVPGYYADPSPDDWLPFVGNNPPVSPKPGQIWVDTSSVPYASYVWDPNLAQFISLGGGPGSDTNSIVSAVTPTVRVGGSPLQVGDLWINIATSAPSYWSGSNWVPFLSADTNSILSSTAPTTRPNGSALVTGDLWTDLDNNVIYYWNGTNFVPVTAVSENIQFAATAPILRSNGDPLVAGDLWTNSTTGISYYYDGVLFVEHKDFNSIESTTAPITKISGGPLEGGDQWFNPTTKNLYTYDSATSAWVLVNNDTHSFTDAGDPITVNPVSLRPNGNPLQPGDLYYDNAGGGLYAFSAGAWNSLITSNTHSYVDAGDPNVLAPYSLGQKPDTSSLLVGDQYIDSNTDISYYWNGTTWDKFGSDTHCFLGFATPTLASRPDGNPLQSGDQFIDQVANKFYYYNGSVWKEIGSDTHSIRATTAPATRLDGTPLKDGDMWVDTDNGNVLSVYNLGLAQWETVGSDTHAFFGALAPTLTLRPDGQPLLIGDQYFNTTTRNISAWNGATWVFVGPNTHSIRATTAPGVRPDGSALEDGDMWVDTDNGNILYVFNFATTSWDLVGPDTHSFTGIGAPNLTLRPDGSALLIGDQYLNTTTKILYAYDGASWVIISGDTHSFTGNGAPGLTTRPDNSALVEGDQYVDKLTGLTYAYYNATWNLTGTDTHAFLGVGDPTLIARPDGTPLQGGDQYINKTNKQSWYYDASIALWQLQTTDLHSFVGIGDPIVANPLATRPDGTALINGDQYVDSNTDILYYWNGVVWEVLSDDSHSYTFFGVPTAINFPTRPDGTALQEGDQVVNKNTELLYYWDGGAWVQVNPDTHSFTGNGEPIAVNPVITRPNASPLVKGDLYIDEATEYLYYYTGATWERITSAETHSFTGNGLPNVIIGAANRPDGDPLIDGDQYFDQSSNLLYTYIAGTWILTSQDTHSFSGAVVPSDPTSGVNAGLRPDGTTLLVGDQYINTATQLLYSWYGGQWNVISGDTHSFIGNVDPASVGSGVDTGTRPDGTPLKAGDMYVNTVTSGIWYYDTALSQWVNTTVIDTHSFVGNGTPFIATPSIGTNTQTLRPDGTALLDGDLYWDKATNILYGYNSVEWVPVSDDLHSIWLGAMTNAYPTAPNVRDDNTALRFGDHATSKDKRLFVWAEDAGGVGLPGWRQVIGSYYMSMYGVALDPNAAGIYGTRSSVDGTTQASPPGDQYIDSQSLGLWVIDGVGTWRQINIDTHAFTGVGSPVLVKRPANSAGYQNDLLEGDLYINTTDGSIYYWDATGSSWKPLTTPDTHSFTGAGAPTLVLRPDGITPLDPGDQYLDTANNLLYGRNAANTGWVIVSGDTQSFTGSGVPSAVITRPDGTALQPGDQYLDTATNLLYGRNAANTGWVVISGDTQSFTGAGAPALTLRPDGAALQPGDQYLDTATNLLYGRNAANTGWLVISDYTHSILGAADPGVGTVRADGTNPQTGDNYINTATGVFWYYDGANWNIASSDTHSFSGAGVPALAARPNGSALVAGDQYLDTATNLLYAWTGAVWVVISGDSHSFTGAGVPALVTRPDGTPLVISDQYLDTTNNLLYGRDATNTSWVVISGDTHSFVGSGAPALVARPDGSVLKDGDIYINRDTEEAYYYDLTGTAWVKFNDDSHSFFGITFPTLVTRPDTTPLRSGDQYFDTLNRGEYVYNATFNKWEAVRGAYVIREPGTPYLSTPVTGTNPITGRDANTPSRPGDLYIDANTEYIYVWDGGEWVLVSKDSHSFTGAGAPVLTARPDGSNLVVGDIYIQEPEGLVFYWDSAAWVEISKDSHSFTGAVDPSVAGSQVDAGNRPNGTPLVVGDQYINTSTDVLWYWDSAVWKTLTSTDTHSFTGNVDPSVPGSLVDTGNRPDGDPLLTGDQYINTVTDALWYWNGAVWENISSPDTHSTTGSGDPNVTAPFSTGFRSDGTTAAITGDIYFDVSQFPSVVQYVYDANTTTWYTAPTTDEHTYVVSGHPSTSIYSTGTPGKMYVNTSTGEFYYWDSGLVSWKLLGPSEHRSGISFPSFRANGIDAPLDGDTFRFSDTGKMYIWEGSWVRMNTHNFVQDTVPPVLQSEAGDTWVDTINMTMYVYYDDGTSTQWAPIA